jgi:hypothetical protein
MNQISISSISTSSMFILINGRPKYVEQNTNITRRFLLMWLKVLVAILSFAGIALLANLNLALPVVKQLTLLLALKIWL